MLKLKSGFITFSSREQMFKECKLRAINIAFKICFSRISHVAYVNVHLIRLINSFYIPLRVIRSEKNVPRKGPVTPRFPVWEKKAFVWQNLRPWIGPFRTLHPTTWHRRDPTKSVKARTFVPGRKPDNLGERLRFKCKNIFFVENLSLKLRDFRFVSEIFVSDNLSNLANSFRQQNASFRKMLCANNC